MEFAQKATAILLLITLSTTHPVALAQSSADHGLLRLHVALVAADLSIKPVPKKRFLVSPEEQPSISFETVTDFSGVAELALAPGSYRIRSAQSTTFEGSSYSWDLPFEISSNVETKIELSNDNASRIEPVITRASGTPPSSTLSRPDRYITIPAGTPVYGELSEGVTSKKKHTSAGDIVRARVWRNVVVDGRTVIEAGSPLVTRVSSVKGARVAGRKGTLELEAVSTRTVDGGEVMLDGGYDKSGKGRMGLSLTLFALVAWPLIFLKGKQAVLDPGTVFDAEVQADTRCALEGASMEPIRLASNTGPSLSAEIQYDEIDPEGKNPTLPIRLVLCSAGEISTAQIDVVNGRPITPPVIVSTSGVVVRNGCVEADSSANLKELGKHMRKGINTFEIVTNGVRVEVVLEVEL